MRQWVKAGSQSTAGFPITPLLALSLLGLSLAGCTQADVQNLSNQLSQAQASLTSSLTNPSPGSAQTPSGPHGVDASLQNILPPFDPSKPISQQYPHIALLVLSSPPNWANGYLSTNSTNANGLTPGCFHLQAIVWSDSQHSKTTAPFNWCIPDDAEIELGPAYLFSLEHEAGVDDDNALAGGTEADGPRPPDTFFPTDTQTENFAMQNNPHAYGNEVQNDSLDLNNDNTSMMALMFGNVRHQLGVNVDGPPDHRVWVASIAEVIK